VATRHQHRDDDRYLPHGLRDPQNCDTAAMHIKLDELIRVTQKARNVLLDLETLDDGELEKLRED
jgi:low affinity Fe/Cu permease